MAYTKKQRQDIFTEQTPFSKNLCIFAPNKILMIKHDKRNYRKHSDRNKELINKSLSEVGAGRSILIDNENEIIAGNGVFEQWGDKPIKIVESDGSELIVVKRTDLSTEDPKRKQLAIMDNSASDSSEFDLELLCEDFESFELESFGVDLQTMEAEVLEAEEDDFDVPEGGLETDIVLGDLFEIGEHRLLCGDSTDSDQVAKLMNGEKADMVFTDPPYNINVNSITFNTKIENDNLNEKDFKDFIQSVISNVFLFCKGSKYICFDIREKSFINIFYENGMKSLIVWVKDIGQHHRENYGVKYELIAYFEDGAFYGENEENVWQCKSIQSAGSKDDSGNLWFNGGSKGLTLHPTQKPILIPTRAINNSSKTNELVLDLFLGSGSTMVASHQLKRKCYGMELDPKYCQVIVDRMRKLDPTIKIKKNGELI